MSTPVRCVIDASVAVKLYFAEPLAAKAHALFAGLSNPTSEFLVPDLFYAECANIVWKHTQRGTCSAAQATSYLASLANLPLQNTLTASLCTEALALALVHNISAYDACYVALAQRRGVSLITADQKLVHKLAGFAPPLVWLGACTPPMATP